MKIGIIGGGAAGMMAAITAAEQPDNQILLFERQARVGRKLLATGNGRCNLTNMNLTIENYHGTSASFAKAALDAFSPSQVREFFQSLGLLTVAESSGRVYPYSDQANSVVDVLRFALARRNIELLTACEVLSVRHSSGQFLIKTADTSYTVDRLIVTAGGLAGTKLGGSLSGYNLLRSNGHHCTKLYPALVQLKTEDTLVKSLKGVRAQAAVSLLHNQSCIAAAKGEIQFTEYGVSGPAVFEVSRAASCTAKTTVQLDLLPDFTSDQLLSALCIRIAKQPELLCDDLLTGFLHNRLGRVILKYAGVDGQTKLGDLPWSQLSSVCEAVHSFSLPVIGTMGMDCAQVTAGGICTEEFDSKTLQSRIVPGLYAAGEVLDIDGDCGGYNLQWAWASGRLAGKMTGG